MDFALSHLFGSNLGAMDWPALHHYAQGRHGAISPLIGPAYGIAAASLRRKAVRDGWPRSPLPGVLLLPGSQPGFWRSASAGLASTRELAVLSHRSAAFAQGLLDREPPILEGVLHRRHGTPARQGWRFHTSRTLGAEHLATVDGLWMTNPTRTLVDLSTVLSLQRLRFCVIDAVRRRKVTIAQLHALAMLLSSTAGGQRLAQVLADLEQDPVDSGFEWSVRTELRSGGREPWAGPFPWRCDDGVVVHLDIAFPQWWVALECDGRGKYDSGSSFTTDRIRWTQTTKQWSIIWVDWHRWHSDRAGVLRDVTDAIAAADPNRPPAQPAS